VRALKRLTALVVIVLVSWLAIVPALAQSTTPVEQEPTTVTVVEEPGACADLGVFCSRLLDWTGNEAVAETIAWLVGTPLKVSAVLAIAVLLNRYARRGIKGVVARITDMDLSSGIITSSVAERADQRASAIGAMMRSSVTAVIYGIACIVVLDILGISIVPIVASLGIAGIAIGFGAQTLIEDLISGIILIVEDQLGVGDRVDVGVVEGDVERVTLRSTVILARNGVRWYVPNSEIKRVANESQHKSRASVQIGVAYSTDLREAASTFEQATRDLAAEDEWSDAGIEDVRNPFVAKLNENDVLMELRLFVEPSLRRPFERAWRERLLETAVNAGIEMPNQQLDVWLRDPAE
jgi:small-conductance mechanosensitive channel